MMPARLAKVGMVASLALFTFLVTLDNIIDYGANFTFVHHVLSMDTTFSDDPLRWRAITAPIDHSR
jgi:predicted small integral membrane protein